eukprot:4005205-Amphidinium_carterae.2
MPEFTVALDGNAGSLQGQDALTDLTQRPTFASVPWHTSTFPELPLWLPSTWDRNGLYAFDLLLPCASSAAVHEQKHIEFASASVTLSLKLATINVRSMAEVGKIKFVADRATQRKIDILFIQETRLSGSFEAMTVDGFELVTSPASTAAGSHGGLAVMVRSDPQLAVVSHRHVSHRVLVVQLCVASKTCRLVCAHAPIAEADDHEHASFARDMTAALSHIRSGELVFVGVDLIMHVLVILPMISRALAAQLLAPAQIEQSTVTINTYIPHPQPLTWRHTSGSEQQIDFVFVPDHLLTQQRVTAVQTGDWSWFDCATTTDHCHVEATVVLTLTPHKRRKRSAAKSTFSSSEHLGSYTRTVSAVLPDWNHALDPRVYMQNAISTMEQVVKETAPKHAVTKKPWITASTWSLMYTINKWRRMVSAWHRRDYEYASLLLCELGPPSFGALLQIQKIDGSTPFAYLDLAAARIRILVRTSRRALRYDKRQWFEAACEAVATGAGSEHLRQLHAAVRLLSRTVAPRGRSLVNEDGTVVRGVDDVCSLWHRHWGVHFNARETASHDFSDRLTMTTPVETPLAEYCDPLGDQDLVFDASEVTNVLLRMPVKRATADVIPAAAYTALAVKLGPPLCALFNLCLSQCQVPLAYAGARVVPVWKKKGSALHCASYRPISLLTLEAKLFAKLCLRKLEARLCYHQAQFGTGHRSGIEYPQVTVIQMAAWALAERVPSATLFVDVRAAFDSVAHPILWGLGAHCPDVANSLIEAGYAEQQAHSLAAFLHTHPTLLSRVGIPPMVVELLRQWGSSTWLVSASSSESAWRPHTGVPQGHNLAALVFDLFYAEILTEIDRKLLHAGIGLELPRCSGRLLQTAPGLGNCMIGGVAYRDDYSLAMVATNNDELIQKLSHAAEIVEAVHSEFHLTLNWAPGKTEATTRLVSNTAKPLYAGLRKIGAVAGLTQPAVALQNGHRLALSATYPHLGRQHAQDMKMHKEVMQRLVKANAAYKERARVFQSRQFSAKVKLQLLRTYVVCHLLQNAGIAPLLSDTDYHRLRSAYISFVRKVIEEHATAAAHSSLTDDDVCTRFEVPTFLTLFDRARLGVLRRLLIADTAPIQALLAAAKGPKSVWSGMLASLRRLHQCNLPALAELPAPSVSLLLPWCQFILLHLDTWKSIVKGMQVPDPPRTVVRDQTRAAKATSAAHASGLSAEPTADPDPGTHGVDVPEQPPQFGCSLCDFTSRSRAGVSMHERRVHKVNNSLAARITSPICPCCELPFATRHRAVDHLRDSARCKAYVLANIAPLDSDALHAVYAANRGVDISVSRMLLPKAGPKPPGERPPCNSVTPVFANETQRQAAIPLLD